MSIKGKLTAALHCSNSKLLISMEIDNYKVYGIVECDSSSERCPLSNARASVVDNLFNSKTVKLHKRI